MSCKGMIITHRGRNTDFAENTIVSFDKAIHLGAEAIECDIHLTLDKKALVHHDPHVKVLNKRVSIAKAPLSYFLRIRSKGTDRILTLDELFEYIRTKNIPFFLEVKSGSEYLIECIIEKIDELHLWSRVYIMGFSIFVGTAVRLQSRYPLLRVIQLINIPLYSYIKMPKQSFGVAVGWIDDWFGSEWLFRKFISVDRLRKLRTHYEKNGFKVMAGVINTTSGFGYFNKAGITDIVTDNVTAARAFFTPHRSGGGFTTKKKKA